MKMRFAMRLHPLSESRFVTNHSRGSSHVRSRHTRNPRPTHKLLGLETPTQ